MAEAETRQTALAGHIRHGRFGAGASDAPPPVRLREMQPTALLHCAGRDGDAAIVRALTQVLGLEPPLVPNTWQAGAVGRAYWLGPARWMVGIEKDGWDGIGQFQPVLDAGGAVTDVSAGRLQVRITGPKAACVLAKGCPLDLHPSVFGASACAQSLLGPLSVLVATIGSEPGFDVFVPRSYGLDLWEWLCDAAAEFGYEVLPLKG